MLDFNNYKSSPPLTARKLNPMHIPVNNFGFNDSGIEQFNEIYRYCLQHEADGTMKRFELTDNNNIRTAHGLIRGARWKLVVKKTLIEIVLRNFDSRYYRFIIGHNKDKEQKIYGRQAFNIYKSELQKFNINIDDLAISKEEGLAIKQTIPKPRIDLVVAPDRTYYNAHHIDLNSAYNAGMMLAFNVLEPGIRSMYQKRALPNSVFKDVLNMTQGFMQSELIQYRFAHISKAGYVYTERRLNELTESLIAQGFRILAYNTDGIWYQSFDGSRYHDADEGDDIGQWKHDYVDCKVRFRSKGCYEVEGTKVKNSVGKYVYKPVFRGESTYERVKPREEWVWGDIYKGQVKEYQFIEGVGITYVDHRAEFNNLV